MKLAISQDSGDTAGTNAFTIDSAPNVDLPSQAEPGTTEAPFSAYHIVPNEYVKVAHKKSATDMTTSTGGVKLTTTYAAYISKTQPADTYSGQVKYALVHPHNTTKPTKPVTIATAEYLQEVNSCPADLSEEQVYTLKDSRDEQEYKVAKLKDGKCWMVENLNIAGGTTLSSEDTDFDSGYSLPSTNGWAVANNKLVLPTSAIKNTENNNLTESSQFDVNYTDIYNYAYVFNSGNKTNCGENDTQNTPCYSYYSWDTATLGSGRSISSDNTDADYSICPKNWRLPTSRSSKTFDASIAEDSDFYNLATNYDISIGDWRQATSNFNNQVGPNTTPNFLRTGYYFSGRLDAAGILGWFWSSTSAPNSNVAYSMMFNQGYINSASGMERSFGLSVRCLLSH